jgi:hypothetical protein
MRRRRRPIPAALLALAFGVATVTPVPTSAQSTAPPSSATPVTHCHSPTPGHPGGQRQRGHHAEDCAGPCCACCAAPVVLRADPGDPTPGVRPVDVPVRAIERPRVIGVRPAPDAVIPFPAGPPTPLG